MEDSIPDFDALYEYITDNSSEVFNQFIDDMAIEEEKRRFYLALYTYSLQQKQRIIIADENFVV
ncbi:transcriptional regulator [Rothia mucilaginosa]|uniref:transcriptional regulator n=1 Tax=Rothia mucilaginosa TaxID=43675 RepID=UPI0028DC572A|nr:transcriptional regulator [Rothia mucilaginosa]